jgi:hypothetical protein
MDDHALHGPCWLALIAGAPALMGTYANRRTDLPAAEPERLRGLMAHERVLPLAPLRARLRMPRWLRRRSGMARSAPPAAGPARSDEHLAAARRGRVWRERRLDLLAALAVAVLVWGVYAVVPGGAVGDVAGVRVSPRA